MQQVILVEQLNNTPHSWLSYAILRKKIANFASALNAWKNDKHSGASCRIRVGLLV
jgi:hypothetical protein